MFMQHYTKHRSTEQMNENIAHTHNGNGLDIKRLISRRMQITVCSGMGKTEDHSVK